jgi:PAS domain S-box-containing protein
MFEDIVETIREPLIVLGSDLRVLSANRSFYGAFKVKPEETIGNLIYDLGNRQWDIPWLRTLLEDILPKNNKFDDYEVEHIFSGVGHKIMLLNARRITHKELGTQMILLALEDITERKRIERLLKANEAKYQELVQNVNSIILKMDTDGKVTFFNTFAEMFFDYAEKELLGRPVVGTIVPETGSDGFDLDFMIKDIEINPEKYVNNENENMRRNGERVWVAWTNKAIRDENGKVIEILCIGNDITERRRLENELKDYEERFRRLFETAKDGLLLIDKQTANIVNVNPAIVEMLGYFSEEFIGKKLKDIGLLKDIKDFKETIRELIQAGFINYEDVSAETKQGQLINVDIHLVDRARFIQCNVRDITERKQAEEEIARSLKEKTVMLREIHDRVKNNLAVIISLLSIQARGIADVSVRVKLREIENRLFSMALIHDNLYNAADLAHIDFKEYLKTLVGRIADTYKRNDVTISVEMESIAIDVNVGIPCSQIVNELVSNSLKHGFPERRKGTIRVGITTDSKGNHVLFVEDNGIGLPSDVDFRNTSSLGLQLVNGLSRQIRGKVELSREVGTRVRITFPGTQDN